MSGCVSPGPQWGHALVPLHLCFTVSLPGLTATLHLCLDVPLSQPSLCPSLGLGGVTVGGLLLDRGIEIYRIGFETHAGELRAARAVGSVGQPLRLRPSPVGTVGHLLTQVQARLAPCAPDLWLCTMLSGPAPVDADTGFAVLQRNIGSVYESNNEVEAHCTPCDPFRVYDAIAYLNTTSAVLV